MQIRCKGRIGNGFYNQRDNFAKVLEAKTQPNSFAKPIVGLTELKY